MDTVVEQRGVYLDNSVLKSLREAEVAVTKFLESNPSLQKRLDMEAYIEEPFNLEFASLESDALSRSIGASVSTPHPGRSAGEGVGCLAQVAFLQPPQAEEVEGGEQDEQSCQVCLHILPVPGQTSDTPVVEDLQLVSTRSEVRQQQKSSSQLAAEDLQSDNKSGKHQGETAMDTVVEQENSMENSVFESLRREDSFLSEQALASPGTSKPWHPQAPASPGTPRHQKALASPGTSKPWHPQAPPFHTA
jgi:hypothetical protein